MAVIYPKPTTVGTENCVILQPKESLIYPMGIGSDWTKIRVGICISYTSPSNENASMDGYGTAQLSSATTEKDRLHYGLKRVAPAFPREANDVFVGLKSYGSSTYIGFPASFIDHRNPHGPITYVGVHHPNGSVDGKAYDDSLNEAYGIVTPSSQNNQTSVFTGLIIWYFEVVNKGQANQQLLVRQAQVQITNTSQASLRNTMIGTSLTTLGTYPFNASGVPYSVPDSFFVYNPITSVRTRVFGFAAIKEA
jgi:hypothetical protein